MKFSKNINDAAITALAAAFCLTVVGCDKSNSNKNGASTGTSTSSNSKPTTPPLPDNTATNKDHDATKSPLDQAQNAADVKITADIRRAIMDDKAMSMNAQNCKVITEKGIVTLRGVVDSQSEKDSVEAKAKAVAGVTRVDNQLEVKVK